jgi:RHS repeat-associated protein
LKFVYDGWNLIAILTSEFSLQTSFLWGLDLSGSEQGAGGVGGLLLFSDHSSPATRHFVAYEGNGNVMALVNAANGTISAQYEYSPFGETVSATGIAASSNPFRFSTKYVDSESGFLYYGYRYYNPSTGRWSSRDPIAERGGKNLYGFALNNPVNKYDVKGLFLGIFCRDKCPYEGKVRIDKVGVLVLPARIDPQRWDAIQISLKATESLEKGSVLIDPNIINNALSSIEKTFKDAIHSVLATHFVFIWTTVEYSRCEKMSCLIFCKRLNWAPFPKSGPRMYSKGALDPKQGYAGLGEAEAFLDAALNEHVSDIEKNPLQVYTADQARKDVTK